MTFRSKRQRSLPPGLLSMSDWLMPEGRSSWFSRRERDGKDSGAYPNWTKNPLPILRKCFVFPTRFRVELRVYRLPEAATGKRAFSASQWFPVGGETDLPALGAPYRKALDRFLEEEMESLWVEREKGRKRS